MGAENDRVDELRAYTLSRGDSSFIHQHVVDAYAVQTATASSKPIGVMQALVGLYLHVEHGLTGRQVQHVHMLLARQGPKWPVVQLPDSRGSITVRDVMAEPAGARRDRAIEEWAAATWDRCRSVRPVVVAFLESRGITPS